MARGSLGTRLRRLEAAAAAAAHHAGADEWAAEWCRLADTDPVARGLARRLDARLAAVAPQVLADDTRTSKWAEAARMRAVLADYEASRLADRLSRRVAWLQGQARGGAGFAWQPLPGDP